MTARVVFNHDGVWYVSFEQTGAFLFWIKCENSYHATNVANTFNLDRHPRKPLGADENIGSVPA